MPFSCPRGTRTPTTMTIDKITEGRELARWRCLAVGHEAMRAGRFPVGSFFFVSVVRSLRFQLPPVKPCVRFSRTRLTDVVHPRHSVSPARPGRVWVRRRGCPEVRGTSVAARCASGCDDLLILHGG